MKATGVVRKVDELGRFVLPMELRRTIGIDPRDPLEVFTDGDSIVLKPYRRDTEKTEIINRLSDVLEYSNNPDIMEIVSEVMEFIKKKA